MADDDDDLSSHAAINRHVYDFIRTGTRTHADELASVAMGLRGGPIGALAMGVAMPVADALGHTIAKATGLEKDDEDR